jgi:hypothetical protein
MAKSALKAILTLLVFSGAALVSHSSARADLIADLVYHITLCGDTPVGCTVVPPPSEPTPPGLDGNAVRDYFVSHGYPDDDIYSLAVQSTNKQGYSFGVAFIATPIDFASAILASGDNILCCIADYPSDIVYSGLNNNNILIGSLFQDGFVTTAEAFDPTHIPTLDEASRDLLESLGLQWEQGFPIFFAVDDKNRISGGFGFTDYFLLTPIPEPNGLMQLATALALLMLGVACRRVFASPAREIAGR